MTDFPAPSPSSDAPSADATSRFARQVSIALVPPSITAVVSGILVYGYQHGSLVHQIVVWLTAMLFSGGLQIVYVLYLRRQAAVSDYDVPLKEQRTKPYLVSAALAAVGFVALWYLNASVFVLALMFVHVINTLVLTVVNSAWKMSAHLYGLLGPLPLLLPMFGAGVLAAVPLVLLLGWARIHLQSHTMPQVIAGAVCGFLLTYLQLFFLLPYALGRS